MLASGAEQWRAAAVRQLYFGWLATTFWHIEELREEETSGRSVLGGVRALCGRTWCKSIAGCAEQRKTQLKLDKFSG